MTLQGKTALVTGGSRGIGRGIVLKLAESGAQVAVHYFQKEDQAIAALEKVRAAGSDGFLVQADVCKPEEIRRMFSRVKSEFGALDIFVNNARPEVPTFYEGPMAMGTDMFDYAMDSQAKAFLVGVQQAVPLLRNGGRIIAMTYAPGGRFGSWQPWVAMGAAQAALEVPLLRGRTGSQANHCKRNQPGLDRGQRVQHPAGRRTGHDSQLASRRMDAHAQARHACRSRKRRRPALLAGSKLDHRATPGCGWRRLTHGCASPAGSPAGSGKKHPRQLVQALGTKFVAQARFLGLRLFSAADLYQLNRDSRHCAGALGG